MKRIDWHYVADKLTIAALLVVLGAYAHGSFVRVAFGIIALLQALLALVEMVWPTARRQSNVTVNVQGSVVSGDDIAKAMSDAMARDPKPTTARNAYL